MQRASPIIKLLMRHALPLQAMDELDNSCAFSKRLYVPPTYAELRKIINIAQAKKRQLPDFE